MTTRAQAPLTAAAAIAFALIAGPALAQGCNQPGKEAVVSVPLPAAPLAAVASRDGCAVFVSLPAVGGQAGGIAIIARGGGGGQVARTVQTPGSVGGLALSSDGTMLAVAAGSGALLYDAAKLASGQGEALIATLDEGAKAGAARLAFGPGGKTLFVADQSAGALSIWDVAGKKRLGVLPIGPFPGGLALSPDGTRLYATVRFVDGKSPDCSTEDGQVSWTAPGELVVIDPAKAVSSPNTAVLGRVTAGCSPTGVAVSPNGDLAYVTARGDDAVNVIRTDRALTDRAHAVTARIKAGTTPSGIAAGGQFVFVANSDNTVAIFGTAAFTVRDGQIPTAGLPRDAALTADGGTLLVTDSGARALMLVDLARLNQFRK